MEIRKAYKIRLYPTETQEQEMVKILGGCRYVWNYYLDKRKSHYLENKKTIPYAEMSRDLTKLRNNTDWLKEINSETLQQRLRILDKSYNRFFRKIAKLPRFKSKYDTKQSFIVRGYRFDGNKLQIFRGFSIKYRGTKPENPIKWCLATIVMEGEKWFACIPVVEEVKLPKRYSKPIGIDVGLTHLAITSNGNKFENLKPRAELQYMIAKTSRELARKVKGSNRRKKTKSRLAVIHLKIRNQRKDYLHKVSSSIASKNHATIAVEDLSVANMMKNHKLAGAFADTGIRTFLTMLKYKQSWKGGKFVKIDRFFPSSKTCSDCQYVVESLPLSVREWTCPKCKSVHDRDINAAKNILQQGLAYSQRRGSRKVAFKSKDYLPVEA